MAESIDRSLRDAEEALYDTVRRAAQGSDSAFAALAARFAPAISRMIFPLSIPEEDKGDLYQEGLIGLYKAVLLYDPSLSSFSTFASVCMRTGVLDGLRKYQKDHLPPSLDIPAEEIPADGAVSPERILLGKEELSALLAKVDSILSPMERKVFGLHLQGKKIGEIAFLLERDTKSVENTLFRLRRKLSSLS